MNISVRIKRDLLQWTVCVCSFPPSLRAAAREARATKTALWNSSPTQQESRQVWCSFSSQ